MIGRALSRNIRDDAARGLALWALLAITWWVLAPGLTGHFIFDDFPNLQGLEEVRRDPSPYGWQRFVNLGLASVLGRPISLLTFAAQYPSWPGNPGDFIRVNVLLHLLNGALLFWSLVLWQRLINGPRGGHSLLTMAVTTLWLLTPLQAGAVFYIVQRMTLLSGTFVLAGLVLHMAGRVAALRGADGRAYVLMSTGTAVALGLGTLAKESAALYPLLVLSLEATLLCGVQTPPRWRTWRAAFLIAPILLLVAYLIWIAPGLPLQYANRPFTLAERLLTEARVLWHYLLKLGLSSIYSLRLMYDDYAVSTSLLRPWTTLPAVISWPLLLAAAVRLRRRWPVAAFAVLWFLSAHALESTFLPLELAFEHRNYLATLGPLLAGAVGVHALLRPDALRRVRAVVTGAAALYVLLTAAFMSQSAALWGRPGELAEYWAHRQPDSRRAQHHYANYLFMYGLVDEGRRVFERSLMRWPSDSTMWLGFLQIGCDFPSVAVPDLAQVAAALRRDDGHAPSGLHMMDGLLRLVESGGCRRYSGAELRTLTQAMTGAPSMAQSRRHLLMLNSRSAELAADRPAAMAYLDEAIAESPRIQILKQGVVWALQADDVERAHRYLAIAESSPQVLASERWTYRLEIRGMRQIVELYDSVTRGDAGAEGGGPAAADAPP